MFMSYVLKVFVDQVWIGNNSSESERRSAVIYAASFSAVVFVLTVVESNTESWMVKDMKLGFTVKQLRDSMATQASIISKSRFYSTCSLNGAALRWLQVAKAWSPEPHMHLAV